MFIIFNITIKINFICTEILTPPNLSSLQFITSENLELKGIYSYIILIHKYFMKQYTYSNILLTFLDTNQTSILDNIEPCIYDLDDVHFPFDILFDKQVLTYLQSY